MVRKIVMNLKVEKIKIFMIVFEFILLRYVSNAMYSNGAEVSLERF